MEEEVCVPPGRMSPAAEDFIRSCLQKDPCSRPSTEDLLKHPWTQVCRARRCCCAYSAVFGVFASKENVAAGKPVVCWCCSWVHETAALAQ